jgi:hypothetical protein
MYAKRAFSCTGILVRVRNGGKWVLRDSWGSCCIREGLWRVLCEISWGLCSSLI